MVILVGLVILVIIVCIAMEFNNIADMKGHTESRYFWWCLLLGPVGWFMVIALPDRGEKQITSTSKQKKKEKEVKRAEEGSVPDEEIIAELIKYQRDSEEQ